MSLNDHFSPHQPDSELRIEFQLGEADHSLSFLVWWLHLRFLPLNLSNWRLAQELCLYTFRSPDTTLSCPVSLSVPFFFHMWKHPPTPFQDNFIWRTFSRFYRVAAFWLRKSQQWLVKDHSPCCCPGLTHWVSFIGMKRTRTSLSYETRPRGLLLY